jgi:hypothetical protein
MQYKIFLVQNSLSLPLLPPPLSLLLRRKA